MKKKSKRKVIKKIPPFVVHHATYPFDVLVCIGTSHDEIVNWLSKHGKVKLDNEEKEKLYMEGVGRTVMLKNMQTVLRLDRVKNPADFHANLVHEVFHAVEFLFDSIGLKYNIDSGEAWAYQIQCLTKQIYSKIK